MGNLLTDKQKEYIRNCNHRWNIKQGAVRSGKTYMDLLYTIPYRILNAQKGLIFIIGNTQTTLETNIFEPMREIYGEELVGSLNRSSGTIRLFGKTVHVYGADKVTAVKRIHGATVAYCYGDEITTWNEEVFEEIKSRLSAPGSKFDGTCNPDSPNHWFKRFLDKSTAGPEEERIDIYQQNYKIDENPHLDPEFVENLKKEYAGTVYYDRFILGKWTLAEGIIYSCYNAETDSLDEVPEPLNGRRIIACDYGTSNACVFLLYEQGNSGNWYQTDEYYYSGRQEIRQKTDEEYCLDYEKFTEGKYIETNLIDPSAASFIVAMRKHGHKVLEADNAVLDGIRRTMGMLNGKKLFILKRCVHTLYEIGVYRWNPKSESDEPIKTDDHCMDAMRYFVNYISSGIESTMPTGGYVPTVESTWSGFFGYGNGSIY